MDSIDRLWERIEAWLEMHTPDIAHALVGGVTEETIWQAEAIMGLALPEDVRASYRRQNGYALGSFLLGQALFYDLTSVAHGQQGLKNMWADLLSSEARTPKALEGPIQPVWWHPAWLPLTGDGAGDLWCIDLAPAPGGQVGQIISFSHEIGPTRVIAASLQALLSTFADQLEAGHYVAAGQNLTRPENIWRPEHRTRSNPNRVRTRNLPAYPTISTRASIPAQEFAETINQLSYEVRTYLEQQGIQPLIEHVLTVYASYTAESDSSLMLEVGIVVAEPGTESERMRAGILPGGIVAVLPQICHRSVGGAVSREQSGILSPADLQVIAAEGFDALEKWSNRKQQALSGLPWLIFWVDPHDPQDVPAPATTVYFEVHQLLGD